jgi:hypothetical protein
VVGICVAAAVAALGACDTVSNGQNSNNRPDVFDHVRSIDLTQREPQTAEVGRAAGGRAPRAESYYAEAPRVVGAAPAAAGGDGYELNFDNAPVTTVAKVILGDILSVGYTIDARVQGTVSLSSGQPVRKADLPYVLENALRLSNVAMVRDAAGYRLLPLGEAVGSGQVDAGGRAQPGYGISVVPLRYVSVQTAIKLFIMVVSNRTDLLKTAATWIARLDKSDMISTGVKVYRVRYGDAKQMAGLLNDIFIGRSAGGGLDAPSAQISPGSGLAVSTSTDRLGGAGGAGATTSVTTRVQPAVPAETRVGETGLATSSQSGSRAGSSIFHRRDHRRDHAQR